MKVRHFGRQGGDSVTWTNKPPVKRQSIPWLTEQNNQRDGQNQQLEIWSPNVNIFSLLVSNGYKLSRFEWKIPNSANVTRKSTSWLLPQEFYTRMRQTLRYTESDYCIIKTTRWKSGQPIIILSVRSKTNQCKVHTTLMFLSHIHNVFFSGRWQHIQVKSIVMHSYAQ